MKNIKKILIANRGEIACRIIRTCRKLGISTVAVYSDIDCGSVFMTMADEAINIGEHGLETYLDQDKIIEAARKTGACAIHPGYGLLSENPEFMSRCRNEGIIFIGPSSEAITAMGSKIMARELCEKIGTPVIPGFPVGNETPEELLNKASQIGFPVLIKASAGGGGIGIFMVNERNDFVETLNSAKKKSMAIYGNDTLLIEKCLKSVRHVEFQVLGDSHGNVIHCFERECSVQRRHQKMIEESPSPVMNDTLRKKMGEAAVAVAKAVNYTNAGTVEFVLNDSGEFYFLEMNTRLQVEHPVTEAVTGLDLVEMQIKIAEGHPLGISQENLAIRGHAIECRVYAEDPVNNFIPSSGKILQWNEPAGARTDSGVETSSLVTINFDPMLAKVIVHAESRDDAIRKMKYALNNTVALGIATNIDFISEFISSEMYLNGDIKTDFFDSSFTSVSGKNRPEEEINSILSAALIISIGGKDTGDCEPVWKGKYHGKSHMSFQFNGKDYDISLVKINPDNFQVELHNTLLKVSVTLKTAEFIILSVNGWQRRFNYAVNGESVFLHSVGTGHLTVTRLSRFDSMDFQHQNKEACEAPMDGIVSAVKVQIGDSVEKGQFVIAIESMKMELPVYSDKKGTVKDIFFKPGDSVKKGYKLIDITMENN